MNNIKQEIITKTSKEQVRKNDIKVGHRIGHVKVLKEIGTHNKMKKYLVRCSCLNIHEAYGKRLVASGKKNNNFRCEKCRTDKLRQKKVNFVHFMEMKALTSWEQMVKICYGKDGNINRSLNENWKDFFIFLKEMGQPKKNECLFHVKQIGEYNKNNCKWADRNFVLANARYI